MPRSRTATLALLSLLASGCGADPSSDVRTQALNATKATVAADLAAITRAVTELRAAAPAPDADGWNATADRAQVEQMRAAWLRARDAYERVEGAIAQLFPDLDVAMDQRYDFFVDRAPDTNLFDDQGATGLHSIERILWADAHPAHVVRFEMGLRNYTPAAYPSSMAEAQAFRDGLCARMIRDAQRLEREFGPLALDTSAAFRGVIGSMEEQVEKIDKAASGEEESRYAQTTLRDMGANLEGGRRTFNAFRPWLESRPNGPALARQIDARFTGLATYYGMLNGMAIPPVPAGFNPDMPSAADLMTPYGQLRTRVNQDASPMVSGSLVSLMNQAADLMSIPRLD